MESLEISEWLAVSDCENKLSCVAAEDRRARKKSGITLAQWKKEFCEL